MSDERTNDNLMCAGFSASISPVCKHPQGDRIQAFFSTLEKPLNLHRVDLPELSAQNVTVDLVRDDLLHPMIAGNKWWKLKHALIHAAYHEKTTLVTFGGAYSNHLLAVAAAGHLFGFKTVGLVRGEEQRELNPVLSQAQAWGMHLEGITREQYRQKHRSEFLHQLEKQWSPCLILPEGGSGAFAVSGTKEMVARLSTPYDWLVCPVGTGGTLAGMIAGAKPGAKLLGFSALKGGGFLEEDVRSLISGQEVEKVDWTIETDYHFGGYAKTTPKLKAFCDTFEESQGVELDLVYTGKMMYGLIDRFHQGAFPAGTRIAAWHTGNAYGLSVAKRGKSHL